MPTLPKSVKPVPGSPGFVWDERARRYRNANTGRFVPWGLIRGELENVVKATTADMKAISQSLQAGAISLADWQLEMMTLIKTTHSATAMMASGGWQQMTQATWGRVGAVVKREYQFLREFAKAVFSGQQKLDGTFVRRAILYGQQGRGTYYSLTNVAMAGRGFDQERSILNPADHCDECVAEEAKGWQPIGQMVPIGRRQCRANCRCSVEYRNSATEEMISV